MKYMQPLFYRVREKELFNELEQKDRMISSLEAELSVIRQDYDNLLETVSTTACELGHFSSVDIGTVKYLV